MASPNPTSLTSALRRLLHDREREREAASASGARPRRRTARVAPMHPSSSAVQREMDWFRRGQGLPYWHHDHRSE